MSHSNNLIDLCESKSERKKLKKLLQEFSSQGVSFIIPTLLELKNIDILQELLKVQDFQNKLGAGFYNFFIAVFYIFYYRICF